MAISLPSAPQTVASFQLEAAGSKLAPETVPTTLSWSRRVSTFVKTHRRNPNHRNLRRMQCSAQVYKVEIEHEGQKHVLDVPEDDSILSIALKAGLTVPYDCNLGVCMTCPAKLVNGTVDQDQGMLSEDVIEKGYTLMCVAYPRSDCTIRVIPEEELLSLQLATADD
ncbi:ferredoxin C 1, chloroplastic isoform X1 [Physcomitrium patens]|uniref:Ferredoxin n=1 Tax=Physcomitrium patens TaxID=3218 RepID=A0A2K1J7D6_PHYPA|nr:uncharacterized protein LOC112293045 [Physcomitrium patens]XP_024397845.1 uncharacterized protein LOC112293045 [Physcomitrium patens]XP_024397846.1 uncharacterized protein LOC112293045 [Physcomitrium patens]XP_024397847.1 uncharacterized protein LOC112293045 [Physcomitrium patens]PNR37436.1 hypothetical protein PHYPA_020545 [Physcomitrium patens]|eukprot:XP_024397844.1 uncharacterized protein LOC112293045 [Physcomitrella patens]